ncbi:MAG: ribosomal-processing cysteine protease Prp [Ruminococcus sp.]|uniref:ribosomal-processing cysteine protease Prp n=1 Tax=Ruminococcus sp. TaxID=41978 RepID=UPI0025CE82E9|nr:ribosomal-processing cysteine protease Prp [Ruminococcus sp.]MBR5681756.1 ribosomal-processing cysteine protease Prp [Ruminococcus sp.]
MIRADFYETQGLLIGFRFSGHSGYADAGEDVVCAAVSSAVQLTVNILDSLGFQTNVKVGDNVISCKLKAADKAAATILGQLKLHFEAILEEFPNTINITISEV